MAESSLTTFISDLKRLLADGEIEQTLEQLSTYLQAASPQFYNEVIVHSSRYRRLRRSERAGSITREQFEADQNKITLSLLALLDEIPSRIGKRMSPLGADVALVEGVCDAEGLGSPEKILGINNLRQISWIEQGMQVSRGVCLILTPGGMGTGFLVDRDLIMTNHHVIRAAEVAGASAVEFDYQQDTSGGMRPSVRYALDAARFHTNAMLDYTLVGVRPEPGKPLPESWGRLPLNPDADPVRSEYVAIVQHPNGGLKQIVLTGSWVVGRKGHLLHYTTDTMPGSSGSPVFNDAWHVIAVHHASTQVTENGATRYVNEGVLLSAIRPAAGGLWPGAAA
jgi:V8-like Glu-specific endopeptidase